LSAQIVIWIEPKEPGRVPAYLREASYRGYRARRPHWDAGTPDGFTGLAYEPNGNSVILLPDNKTNHVPARTTINISCFLNGWSAEQSWPEGLLPLPTDVRRIDNLPDMVLSKNENGAVLAGGRGIVIFDATYAAGATIDSPPDIDNPTNRWDLSISPMEASTIKQAVSELDLATNADFNTKLRAVQRFFLSKFTYSVWQGPDMKATNMTALTRFLLVSHTGHCEYFATATVLMLRALDIPARYAVGYAVHETSGTGYVVRERDAHAWCLVWNDAAQCWQDFDTTPSSWIGIESKRTAFWEWLSDIHSWLRFEFAAFRWRQAHLQQYIIWALVPMMSVLLFHIIFKRRGKLRATAKNIRDLAVLWPGLDSEFYQLEKKLAGFGLPRQPAEPLSLWLERVSADPALIALREPLQKLLRLHYRHRFDPRGLDAGEREQLRREAKTCLDSLLAPRP
jgi:transglutaminase-like putative cysteine protease